MRGGTLFSGIGAPECAMPWVDWRWAAEIDPFASAVHAARFPGVPNLGDVTEIAPDAVEPVDLVVFGSPCQSFSVAGKRLGLDDPRGNLTLVGIQLIAKLKPRYVIWENVPGVLSDDDGETIQTVIELFTQIGYVCDTDIWDAQHFGIPQRRRRVFVTCVLLDDLMKAKTPISERIMGDLLAQALLATWGAALGALCPEPGRLVFASQIGQPVDSLQKKMRSLDALLGGSAVTKLLDFWAENLAPSMAGQPNSASTSRPPHEPQSLASKTATDGSLSLAMAANASGDKSIGLSPRALWGDLWQQVSAPTTSTSTSSITNQEICSFARLSLSIVQSIISSPRSSLSQPWSSDYWNLAFSGLTLARDVIEYAGSASCELFSTSELRDGWRDNLDAARSCYHVIERRVGDWANPSQILLISQSLRGNPPPRREAGERVARPVASGPQGGSGYRNDADTADNLIAFSAKDHGGDVGAIAPTLRAGPHDKSHANAGVMPAGGRDGLAVNSDRNAGFGIADDGSAYSIMATKPHGVFAGAVRRLTPRECERLQGFPDNWTAIQYRGKPAADGPRYRALGNSMAVPVIGWVGHRIQLFENAMHSLAGERAA